MNGVFIHIYDKGYVSRKDSGGWTIDENIDNAYCFETVKACRNVVENFFHLTSNSFGFLPGVKHIYALRDGEEYLLCYEMGSVHMTSTPRSAMTWDDRQKATMYADALNKSSTGKFNFQVVDV